jgi:hypothetical protein
MTPEDDRYALKEFFNGVAVTLGVVGVAILIIGVLTMNNAPIDQPSFEVVDQYEGCDVVRYSPNQVSTYKYLLYCEDHK